MAPTAFGIQVREPIQKIGDDETVVLQRPLVHGSSNIEVRWLAHVYSVVAILLTPPIKKDLDAIHLIDTYWSSLLNVGTINHNPKTDVRVLEGRFVITSVGGADMFLNAAECTSSKNAITTVGFQVLPSIA